MTSTRRTAQWILRLAEWLAIALCALAAAAQEPGELRRSGIFTDSIDVTIVNVEVVARDDRGRAVDDLQRVDFEILEDGEPVELSNFYSFQGAEPAAPGAAGLDIEAGGVSGDELSSRPEKTPKTAILLIDDDNLSPANRNRVLGKLREHVGPLIEAGTSVMVVAKSRSVEIEQRLTTDPVLVLAAIDRIESRAGGGAMSAGQKTLLRRQIERGSSPSGGGGAGAAGGGGLGAGVDRAAQDAEDLLSSLELYAQELYQEVRRSTEVLGRFVSALAGLPGRKALVYVSDGLPARPGEMLFRLWFGKYGSAYGADLGVFSPEDRVQEYDVSLDVLDLIAAANSNRVVFYPIDAGRDPSSAVVSAASSDLAATDVILATASEGEGLLGLMARETGGVALLHDADVGTFVETVREDLTRYYSLGFVSPHQGDGKVHDVKVKVQRKGVKLRYLERYLSKSSEQDMVDRTLTALLLDRTENPMGVRLELEAESRLESGDFLVPVVIRVPIAELALIPQESAHVGQLTIYVAVRDAKGRATPNLKIDLPVSLPNDKLLDSMSQFVGYRARLKMRSGEQKIAIGVYDELARQGSTVNLNVSVGDS